MPEITDNSVSHAWLQAVRLANATPRKEVSNLVVHIENLSTNQDLEDPAVRFRLNEAMEANGDFSIPTVANTIFPSSLWRPGIPRQQFFDRYSKLWPRIHKIRQNRRGTYFQRLISYPEPSESAFNQLEFVISAYRRGIRRRSALQCGLLAPHLDLNATPFQGFPCLQQLAFLPEPGSGLRVCAVYPMHYLWARAYGNYLGLIALGKFMAIEMGLELTALTCVAFIAKLDEPTLATRFEEGR